MNDRLQLEIDRAAFERLLTSNGLSLKEFSCSDKQTKKEVHDLYLQVIRRNWAADFKL
ncbi:MAG: hypothetical protein AB8B95_00440 [Pseudohongiellaceae bacterium]